MKVHLLPLGLVLAGFLFCLSARAQQAPSEATNIRITTDEQTKRLVILYDLPTVQPTDSLYVEIETSSGRRFRPITVSGNVGKTLTPGRNKTIYWDVVRDNVQLDEEVEVIIRLVRLGRVARPQPAVAARPAPVVAAPPPAPVVAVPTIAIRKKSPLPVIGWVAAGGLAAYAFSLSSGLNKDVNAYNAKSQANTLAEWNSAEAKRTDIDSRQGRFTLVAGATAALVVGNIVALIVRKSKQPRTAWQIGPGHAWPGRVRPGQAWPGRLPTGAGQVIQLGLVRTF